MSKEVGKRYRKYILEPGGLNSGFDKLKNFLGREPSDEAYLAMNGFTYDGTEESGFMSVSGSPVFDAGFEL